MRKILVLSRIIILVIFMGEGLADTGYQKICQSDLNTSKDLVVSFTGVLASPAQTSQKHAGWTETKQGLLALTRAVSRRGTVLEQNLRGLEEVRWHADPEVELASVTIRSIQMLTDNNNPKLPVAIIKTDKGDFLIIYEDGGPRIAVKFVDVYIDLSDRPYFSQLKNQFTRIENAGQYFTDDFLQGNLYGPMIEGDHGIAAFEEILSKNLFLRYLLTNTNIVKAGLGLSGAYVFDRNRNVHYGAAYLSRFLQVFNTFSRNLDQTTIAHEIVHAIFKALLVPQNQFNRLFHHFATYHHDLIYQTVAAYYGERRELTEEERRGLFISEALAMTYDSFISPRFTNQGVALIRMEDHKLLVQDVKLLMDIGLIPEQFNPDIYGYGDTQEIDVTYYKAVLESLSRSGLVKEAENFVDNIKQMGQESSIQAEMQAAIRAGVSHTENDISILLSL